mgnify:CR=1
MKVLISLVTASSVGHGQSVLPTGPTNAFVDIMRKPKAGKVSKYTVDAKVSKKKKRKKNVEGAEMDTQPAFHMNPRW